MKNYNNTENLKTIQSKEIKNQEAILRELEELDDNELFYEANKRNGIVGG
jgi:hypothetical protein